jgi:branched-chain amino acid transport system ATP-binding protein
MLLEVEHVSAGYGGSDVLQDVSLRVADADITALIGPNGAGKSTLVKAIFGFVRVRQGEVRFAGQDITNRPPEAVFRCGLRYLHQDRSVFPRLTVYENLLIAGYHERDRRRVERAVQEVFDRFPVLGARRRQLASRLSGGEQRMLELGRAFMFGPRLILLDEPSVGLAPQLTDELYASIVALARTGEVAFLIVEQNVAKALEVARHCYVLDLGRNVFEGTPTELRHDDRIVELYVGR